MRKCSRNCMHVVMWGILILSWYIKQSLSVSVLLCYMVKSLDWDLRVIHDIIACYSEIYFSMLFSRFESDTLITQFTTLSSWRFDGVNYKVTIVIISWDNDSLIFDMHIMTKTISRYYHSNYHPDINKISKYQFSNK